MGNILSRFRRRANRNVLPPKNVGATAEHQKPQTQDFLKKTTDMSGFTENLQVGFGGENTFSMENEQIELKKADIESKSKFNE